MQNQPDPSDFSKTVDEFRRLLSPTNGSESPGPARLFGYLLLGCISIIAVVTTLDIIGLLPWKSRSVELLLSKKLEKDNEQDQKTASQPVNNITNQVAPVIFIEKEQVEKWKKDTDTEKRPYLDPEVRAAIENQLQLCEFHKPMIRKIISQCTQKFCDAGALAQKVEGDEKEFFQLASFFNAIMINFPNGAHDVSSQDEERLRKFIEFDKGTKLEEYTKYARPEEQIKNMYILMGRASPPGNEDENRLLSNRRISSTVDIINKYLNQYNVKIQEYRFPLGESSLPLTLRNTDQSLRALIGTGDALNRSVTLLQIACPAPIE